MTKMDWDKNRKVYPSSKYGPEGLLTPARLHVPFDEKDEAKAAGAWWNGEQRYWYAPYGVTPELKRWWRG